MPNQKNGYEIVDSMRLPGKTRINEVESQVKVSSKSGRAFVNVPRSWKGKTLRVYRDFVVDTDDSTDMPE